MRLKAACGSDGVLGTGEHLAGDAGVQPYGARPCPIHDGGRSREGPVEFRTRGPQARSSAHFGLKPAAFQFKPSPLGAPNAALGEAPLRAGRIAVLPGMELP